MHACPCTSTCMCVSMPAHISTLKCTRMHASLRAHVHPHAHMEICMHMHGHARTGTDVSGRPGMNQPLSSKSSNACRTLARESTGRCAMYPPAPYLRAAPSCAVPCLAELCSVVPCHVHMHACVRTRVHGQGPVCVPSQSERCAQPCVHVCTHMHASATHAHSWRMRDSTGTSAGTCRTSDTKCSRQVLAQATT